MIKTEILWDFAKIGAQGIVGVVVAWLAVRWALSRYKREKLWERRLAAYADVVSALADMRRLNGQWAEDEEDGRQYTESVTEERSARYRTARRRFDDVVSVAALILDDEINLILSTLERDLASIDQNEDSWERHNDYYSIIDDALVDVVAKGRKALA